MTISEIPMVEVGKSVMEMAEEAGRAAMEAVDASIFEVTRAAEAAQTASQQAIAQAEEVNKSVREMAEEVMRAAIEATETARMLSQQAINRSEEFRKSAKEKVEEAARVARETIDSVIREATKAAETAQATLRQAASRSEEINNLVEELAEQATKSAREAVESAKIAFQESLSRSINRPWEERRLKELEVKRVKNAEETRERPEEVGKFLNEKQITMTDEELWIAGAARKNQRIVTQKNRSQEENTTNHRDTEQAAAKIKSVRRAPWRIAIANSLKKSSRKTKEPEESDVREKKVIKPQTDDAVVRYEKSMKDNVAELYEGLVRIGVASGSSPEELGHFEKQLRQLENLKVLWTSKSDDGGTSIGVSMQKPVPLIYTLNELPGVYVTGKEDETVMVALKGMPVA